MKCYYVYVTTFDPRTSTSYLGQWWGDTPAQAIEDARRDCTNASGVFTAQLRPFIA